MVKRTETLRLLPTNKKARLLNKIGSDMAILGNYVVEKYIEELHGNVKLSNSVLWKGFAKSDSPFYLGKQSDFISKSKLYQSILEKIEPNLKNYIKGNTKKPSWESFIHFCTQVVEFEETDNGYYGITINHPNKRAEKIFIKLVENERNEEKIEKIKESGAEDTFTCEIQQNYNGKWILFAMIDIGDAPDLPDEIENIIGVDLGLRFVATACVVDREGSIKDVKFFRGGELFKKRKELSRRIEELQEGGHRKAYDRLKNRDGEIIKHKNHEVSKEIVNFAEKYKPCVIIFEDLEGSKDDMKEESFKESGDIKGKAGRFRNRLLSFWSPSMLKEFVQYKAEEKGIDVYNIDPKYTSQTCPKCGYKDRSNRRNSQHKFICQECNYEINDDLVGAKNIAKRGETKISG